MNWMSMVPAGMSLFGAFLGWQGGENMQGYAKDQERMAEENALQAKSELREQVRRQEMEDQRLRASAVARSAASGATISGSAKTEIDWMKSEQDRQLKWTKSAGASRIRLNLASEKLRADALETRGETQKWTSLIGGVGSAFGRADRAGFFGT